MNRALLCSQCIRLLNSGDKKSILHIDFWMGSLLANVIPSMGAVVSDVNTPEYFSFLGDCLATLMVKDALNSSSIRVLTNRVIYSNILELSEPKIVQDNPDFNYTRVWKRLQSPAVSWDNRDIWLKLLHNKLPVQERLHRIGVVNSPLCSFCTIDVTADAAHFFCHCVRIRKSWSWLRLKLLDLSQVVGQSTDWEILNLMFPKNSRENELIWLLGHYVNFTWKHFTEEQTEIDIEKLIGYFMFTYKERDSCVGNISGLD